MKLKKYYNVFFPIWLIILFPPIIFITLIINFIIDSLVIIFTLKYLKIFNYKNYYKKTIIKTWILGFIADLIGVLILLFIDFFMLDSASDIISAIYLNPFNNFFSFLIVSFTIFIVGYFIYLFNYYLVFNKKDLTKKDKKILALSLAVFTAPYLFLLPTSLFV